MEVKETLVRIKNFKYMLIAEGAAAGLLAGFAVSVFRLGISGVEILRDKLTENGLSIISLVFFAALYLVTLACLKFENNCSGSGIPHIKGELEGRFHVSWIKVLPAKIIGGICATGAGLSVGREGPSVQIGAMAAKGFSSLTNRLRTEERLLITAGAGAGLSAAFNAPLAGVVFSLEELHKNLSLELMLTSMAACVTSDFVSSYIFGLNPVFSVIPQSVLPLRTYWLLIIFGIILGISGALYNLSLKEIQKAYKKIPFTWIRLLIPFAAAAVLCRTYPYILGGGNHIVDMIAETPWTVSALLVLLVAKFIYSMISFCSGTPGGIFLPLLVLGAVTGAAFAQLTGYAEFTDNFIILGMAGYFTAIVRSPITGIILISEMTGSLSHLLSLSLVCLTAYIVADLLGARPVYDQLLDAMTVSERPARDRKIIIESMVVCGALMDNRPIREFSPPKGVLIISIDRNGSEIVPSGDTVLKGGDELLLLCSESRLKETKDILFQKCEQAKEFISATQK